MTDPEIADRTYLEPLHVDYVSAIIEREKPHALLPTVGGQTALNLALQLQEAGVLDEHNVELIGAGVEAIRKAESREEFDACMRAAHLQPCNGGTAGNLEEARQIAQQLGLPVIVRPSFTLGGSGGRYCGYTSRVRGHRQRCSVAESVDRSAYRGVPDRLEGIRARGCARFTRQRHHCLFHREHRCHGGAHRRQCHRSSGHDIDGS